MKHITRQAGVALLLAAALAGASAGTVEVTYDPASAWTDAGSTPRERGAHLEALATTLRALAPRLPGADTVLRVQLIDVDLAGTPLPVGPGGQLIRVVRGGADWPRLQLRYTVLDGARELRHGEESLADMNYTWRDGVAAPSDPLLREKRLLTDWFDQRILGGAAAP